MSSGYFVAFCAFCALMPLMVLSQEDKHPPSCADPDEQYYVCAPYCHNTCENYNKPYAFCRALCITGCFCREGLMKRKDGKCIEPRDCPQYGCGINEEIVECSKPKWCNTCEIRGNCLLAEWKKGCDCKKGYFKNDYDVCAIPEDQCGTCGENEQYNICGPLCQQSCNTLAVNTSCEDGCEAGCFCRKGYVRDEDNNCIPPSKCPPDSCPKNEEPSDCVVPCNDCEIRGRCRFFACHPGCNCEKGYYRNSCGRCIPEKKCPTECPPNEEMSTCQTPCKACEYQAKGCPIKVRCKVGCECKQGFARTVAGRCIPIEDCRNEKY